MTDVTVITPVFNTQDYLHRCITSVQNQAGVELRHILIDDGSTDNSARIIEHYQKSDPRIVFIRQANRGQGPARNLGLRLADSEFVCFVDSDDYLGEGTLAKLARTARAHTLDICAPNVASHYFERPLELTACLPNKAQFIRREIIDRFDIEQPDVRSGQDGVFSHLVLTHCTRIGMVRDAEYIYTHARPGSTFQGFLKRHDLVPGIIKAHLASITAHYDRWQLWEKNSDRLLCFILDETLKNRLVPHYDHLDIGQRADCLTSIFAVSRRCLAKSRILARGNHPLVQLLVKWSGDPVGAATELVKANFEYDQPVHEGYPADHLDVGMVRICKFAQAALLPDGVDPVRQGLRQASAYRSVPENDSRHSELADKLNFTVNSLLNLAMLNVHASWQGAPSLEQGEPGLIVNMTVMTHRLPTLHLVLASLFSQTRKPAKVIIWLPDTIDTTRQIPPEVTFYLDKGLELRSVTDVGPHTKLLYALQEFPKERLVTVDDDIIYPANMIQALLFANERHPDAVIANWARELAFSPEGKVLGVRKGRLLTPPTLESDLEQAFSFVHEPSLLAFPYGTSGVLYPPGCMDRIVFDVTRFQRLCPKEDDIWFKACSLKNGVSVVTTGLGINPVHHCLLGTQAVSLRHYNHGADNNEIQMQGVFEELDLYRLL